MTSKATIRTFTAALVTALALGLPIARAFHDAQKVDRIPELAHWIILALMFAVLLSAMVMPLLVWGWKILLKFIWTVIKMAARLLRDEILKWLLLVGATSLGILHFLQWLPLFR